MMMTTPLPRRRVMIGPYFSIIAANQCATLCSAEALSLSGHHAVKTNRKYNTHCFFGNGFSQSHVAGGPGGSGTPFFCVGAVAKMVLERRRSTVAAAALPATYVQGTTVVAMLMPFPSKCIVLCG